MEIKRLILNAEDLCSIIKACGESKVVEFITGDFTLKFGKPSESKDAKPGEDLPEEIQAQSAKELLRSELEMKQDQLDQMLIEDPLRAEELILRGELEDDRE